MAADRDLTIRYCQTVADSMARVIIDKETGKQAYFRRLFYPMDIDEGQYACLDFNSQVRRTEDIATTTEKEVDALELARKVSGAIMRTTPEAFRETQSRPKTGKHVVQPGQVVSPGQVSELKKKLKYRKEPALDASRAQAIALKEKIRRYTTGPVREKTPPAGGDLLSQLALLLQTGSPRQDTVAPAGKAARRNTEVSAAGLSEDAIDRLIDSILSERERRLKSEQVLTDAPFPADPERHTGEAKGNAAHAGKQETKIIREEQTVPQDELSGSAGNNSSKAEAPEVTLLQKEPDPENIHLLSFHSKGDRCPLLLIANAGSGKTVLLTRIALFYCACHAISVEDGAEELDEPFMKKYGLQQWPYIPFLIRLREKQYAEKEIGEMILSVAAGALPDSGEDEIKKWIAENEKDILLLIDGLDELPEGKKEDLLERLSAYMSAHRLVSVILSSRVAGLNEDGVEEALGNMGFHGRSVMPLSEDDIVRYSRQWIEVTQERETDRKQFMQAVKNVREQDRYAFLRDFMRKPLELTIILRQIIKGHVSTNKWRMFEDILREEFTNHTPIAKKQAVYEDTMLLLSLIAYIMQKNDSLYFTADMFRWVEEEIRYLPFQTRDFVGKTERAIREKLDELAANTGIIEKCDGRSDGAYTFPIRAYLEYMAAYACCHICLGEDRSRPAPLMLLRNHINDENWRDVVEYAVLDLEGNHSPLAGEFKKLVFSTNTEAGTVMKLLEDGVQLDQDNAESVCEMFFGGPDLSAQQRELLDKCLMGGSAFYFMCALYELYCARAEQDRWRYLEATAYAFCYQAINDKKGGEGLALKAKEMLRDRDVSSRYIASEIFVLLSRMALREDKFLALQEEKEKTVLHVTVDDEAVSLLRECALANRSAAFVLALTELRMARLADTSPCLDEEMWRLATEDTDLSLARQEKDTENGTEILKKCDEYACMLSAFPLEILKKTTLASHPLARYVRKLKEDNATRDRIAVRLSGIFLGDPDGRFDDFTRYWAEVYCHDRPYYPNRKLQLVNMTTREQHHFQLLQPEMREAEEAWFRENPPLEFDDKATGEE